MYDRRIQFGVQSRVPNQVALVLVVIVGLAISIFTIKAGEKIVSGFYSGAAIENLKNYNSVDTDGIPIKPKVAPTVTPKKNSKVK